MKIKPHNFYYEKIVSIEAEIINLAREKKNIPLSLKNDLDEATSEFLRLTAPVLKRSKKMDDWFEKITPFKLRALR